MLPCLRGWKGGGGVVGRHGGVSRLEIGGEQWHGVLYQHVHVQSSYMLFLARYLMGGEAQNMRNHKTEVNVVKAGPSREYTQSSASVSVPKFGAIAYSSYSRLKGAVNRPRRPNVVLP